LAHEFGRSGAYPFPSRPLRSLDLGGGPGAGPRPSRPTERPAGQDASPHGHIPGMSVHHFDMWWYITGRRPVEIRADPIVPPGDGSGRPLGYSMRATLEDGLHVQYFDRRALARPQTTWYGDLWVVGEEGALFWNGVGSAVTLSRSLPTHDYREQHLASGPVSFVSRDGSGGATMVMVRVLVEAIRQGRPHPCDMEDNWVSFATAMAAVESAQTGQAVKVERE
ncbi:MAG TPA: hypothetical protein VHN78_05260, partial [Chloroflexota bacterium]|nr:hypothetical protein [Chloroflexota bacterium]